MKNKSVNKDWVVLAFSLACFVGLFIYQKYYLLALCTVIGGIAIFLINKNKWVFSAINKKKKESLDQDKSSDGLLQKKVSAKWVCGIFLFIVVLSLSFVHIITGGYVGFAIVPKNTIGFKDTFINVDEITGMPWIVATSKYPIAVKILQQEGIIESDEARERRLHSEMMESMERSKKEFEMLMNENRNK